MNHFLPGGFGGFLALVPGVCRRSWRSWVPTFDGLSCTGEREQGHFLGFGFAVDMRVQSQCSQADASQ